MSETLVDRIDDCLKYRNLKRLALCEAVGITTTAITHWSVRNGLPSADTAVLIARYLDVSVDWLIFGTVPDPAVKTSPQSIAIRIENALTFLTGVPSYTEGTAWFKPLEAIMPIHSFYNLRSGRNDPDITVLQKVANVLGIQLSYLLTGTDKTELDSFICKLADTYESVIKAYHCLTDDNQRLISTLIAQLNRFS